jgi:hypothetical protein
MSGRTERVNAREVMTRIDKIILEADTARGWLIELERRAKSAAQAARGNSFFRGEWKTEYDELVAAIDALKEAQQALVKVSEAVARRESEAA